MMKSTRPALMLGRFVVLCAFAVFAYPLQADDKISYTGFLEHYPELKPEAGMPGVYVWKNPKADMKKYDKLMVAPLEVWLSPDSEYKGLSADQLTLVNGMYQANLSEVMEPDYPLVSKPGEGVLVLRVALTEVKIKKRERGFRQWLPPMLIYRGADTLLNESLKSLQLNDAQMEGELRDSQTNELIRARVVVGVGKEGKEIHFEGVMDYWQRRAKQLYETLEEARR